MPCMKRYPRIVAMLALLVLTASAGRGLTADPLWYDEHRTIFYAGGGHEAPISPAATWYRVQGEGEAIFPFQTPGYFMLYGGWVRLTGWSAFSGRYLSLLFGVLAAAVVYALGRDLARDTDLAPDVVGLSALTLLSTSAFYIYYLHELRVYTLIALLTALALWLYWQMMTHQRGGIKWLGMLVITFAALFYVHYLATVSALAIGVYHLLFAPKNRWWWRVTAAMISAGLTALVWLLPALTNLSDLASDPRTASALSHWELLIRLPFSFSNGGTALLGIVLVFAVRRGGGLRYGWVWLITSLVLLLAINVGTQALTELRYLMALWVGLALLAGFGVAGLAQRGVPLIVLLGLWGAVGVWSSVKAAPLMVAFSDPQGDRTNNSYGEAFLPVDWERLQATLAERAQPEDALAYHRPDIVWAISGLFDYYLGELPLEQTIMEYLPGRDIEGEYQASVAAFLADADRAWIAVDRSFAPTFRLAAFQSVLDETFDHCERVFRTRYLQLDLYARPPDNPTATFGADGIALTLLEPAPIDDSVLLGWEVGVDVPPQTYSYALHVEDSAGNLVAQVDHPLPEAGFHCERVTLPVTLGADQTLLGIVYRWTDGERLPTHTGTTRARLAD